MKVLTQMSGNTEKHSIIAIIYEYSDEADQLLARIASRLIDAGARLAGFIQHDEPRENRAKCDMILEEISSGERFKISEDRGAHARACRLNIDWLLTAANAVLKALDEQPDLLIINKFGKAEAEGGGLRHLIVKALETGVPVLVAVPCRNLDNWRAFADGISLEIPFAEAEKAITGFLSALLIDHAGHMPEATVSALFARTGV